MEQVEARVPLNLRSRDLGLYAVLVLLCLGLSILKPDVFPSLSNLLTVLKQTSIIGVLAIGATVVIISGGIDLSLGSVVALAGVIAAYFAQVDGGSGAAPAVLAGMAVGLVCGVANGAGIVFGRLPPFIMTLATLSIARGLAYLFTEGRPISNLESGFQAIGRGSFAGISNLIFIYLLVAAVVAVLLHRTVFGRHVYAIGSNETAAKNSGVKVGQIKLMVYALSGVLAGLAGVMLAARTTVGSPVAGVMFELDAIAAAVIGGASLSGGRGKVINAVLGALIINVVSNGLDIMGLSTFIQQIIKGSIVIVAVLIDMRSSERRE